MSIRPLPKKPTQAGESPAVARFIEQAPDGNAAPPKSAKGAKMTQISLKLDEADLARIDKAADGRRISRAAFIRQAVFQQLNSERTAQ